MPGLTAMLFPYASVWVELPEFWVFALLSPGVRVFAFVWGLLWGSFANVVIARVPEGLSVVRPRSRCPACETPISGFDNIPVLSYLLLRGKCRHCEAPVSLRYPTVELISGALCFALYMRLVYVPMVGGGGANLVGWLLAYAFCLVLLIVIYIDLDHWIIPVDVVVPMAVIGAVAALLIPDALGVGAFESVLSAIAGFVMFAGIRQLYLWTRDIEALGLGDAYLLLMVGAFTGAQGLAWTIGAGAVQGLVVSVPLLLYGRQVANTDLREAQGDDPLFGDAEPKTVLDHHVPFGPFLAVAALEFILLRPTIEGWTHWLLYG